MYGTLFSMSRVFLLALIEAFWGWNQLLHRWPEEKCSCQVYVYTDVIVKKGLSIWREIIPQLQRSLNVVLSSDPDIMTASVTQDKLQFSFSTLLKPWWGTVPNQKFAIQTPYQVQEFLLFYCRKTSTFFQDIGCHL